MHFHFISFILMSIQHADRTRNTATSCRELCIGPNDDLYKQRERRTVIQSTYHFQQLRSSSSNRGSGKVRDSIRRAGGS